MIDAAKRKRKDNGAFELTWDNAGVSVTANLKIVGTTPHRRRRRPPVGRLQAPAPAGRGDHQCAAARRPPPSPAPPDNGVIRTAGAQP
jgi:type VI secretion system protein ImpL